MPTVGYIELMPQGNWIIALHFVLLWGSVITGLAAGWRIPIPLPVAVLLGLMVWSVGFLYNVDINRRRRGGPALHRAALARRGHLRIAARTLMNLGVALGFKSWLTLIVAFLLIPFYAAAARGRQRYLDYPRSGMLGDAFPDRVVKR